MTPISSYLLLTLAVLLWIAWDSETASIFDVFGRSFYFVWFESGQRWRHVFAYGWRLVLLLSVLGVNSFLAYQVYVTDPLGIGGGLRLALLLVMVAGAWAPIPWISIAGNLRRRRVIRSAARRFSAVAELVAGASDPAAHGLERADYSTADPWTAWFPVWKDGGLEESRRLWDGLVPVLYLRADSSPAVLIPIDWEVFLGWNITPDWFPVDQDLPVHGAYESSFRLKSIKPLRACPNWSLIYTDMHSEELDAIIEQHSETAIDRQRVE